MRTALVGGLTWFGAGCYSGLSARSPFADGADAGATDDGEGSGDDGDDGGSEGGDGGATVGDPQQIRLLNASEYRATIFDLLGVEASPDLDFADRGAGYDSGSNGELGESLFSVLFVEAERIAEVYVNGVAAAEFPCFSASAALSEACLATIVDGLGPRAFRRPLDAATRADLLAFAQRAASDADGSSEVLRLLVVRMLMSPRFLYRTEIGRACDGNDGCAALDPFERASLLSYALTGSMPDPPLAADAAANRLDETTTAMHAGRLLATPRGRAHTIAFFEQWLRVQALRRMAEAPTEYPKLDDPQMGQSLHDEFAAFVAEVVFEDEAGLPELLTRNLTFVDRRTAPLYGATSASDVVEPLMVDPEQRAGILTLASVLAVHGSSSEVSRDKPIRRGLLVKNQLLCEEVGLPDGIDVQSAAEDVIDDVEDFEALTTREQFELMMNQDPVCVACHATFMPYGYLWSHFDALGQYQTHFGDRELDARVEDLTVDGTARTYDGIMDMLPELASSERVARCFVTQVLRQATGRHHTALTGTVAAQLAPQVAGGELGIVALLQAALSRPELYIREVQ